MVTFGPIPSISSEQGHTEDMCVYPKNCIPVFKTALNPSISFADKPLHFLTLRKKQLLCSLSLCISLYLPSHPCSEPGVSANPTAWSCMKQPLAYDGCSRMFYSSFQSGHCSHNYYTLPFPVQITTYPCCPGEKFWVENLQCICL